MYITLYWAIQFHFLWFWKAPGISVCADEGGKYAVARVNGDLFVEVLDCEGRGGCAGGRVLAVCSKGSVETDAFHQVMQDQVVCFGCIEFREAVEFGEMNGIFGLEIEV